jgi:hypothetical protein
MNYPWMLVDGFVVLGSMICAGFPYLLILWNKLRKDPSCAIREREETR